MILIVCVAFVIAVAAAVVFNRLVRFRTLMGEAASGIDVQLKRRYDLIPNIVETVKGYMQYERAVLEKVVELRNQAMNGTPGKDRAERESRLSGALKRVFALVENYPDLKANTSFLGLQSALVQVEDDLQLARRYFNGTVRNYNILVQSFPGNLVALLFGFRSADFFEIEYATERKNPDVRFV